MFPGRRPRALSPVGPAEAGRRRRLLLSGRIALRSVDFRSLAPWVLFVLVIAILLLAILVILVVGVIIDKHGAIVRGRIILKEVRNLLVTLQQDLD